MAPLIVYGMMESPPVRAVLLTARALGIPYELKEVNLLKGQHLTPEYKKINPQQKIPAIDDDGFILSESHAIVVYLVAKYGKNDTLYPEDIQKRAIINERMYFNSNTLFPKLIDAGHGLKTTGAIPDTVLTKTSDSLKLLEILLGDDKWIGQTPTYTVGDLCVLSVLENYTVVFPSLVENHGKLVAWLQRARESIEGYEEITRPAVKALAEILANVGELRQQLKFMAN